MRAWTEGLGWGCAAWSSAESCGSSNPYFPALQHPQVSQWLLFPKSQEGTESFSRQPNKQRTTQTLLIAH